MMTMHHDPSISDVMALVRERQLSPVELVRRCLQRIDELNPTINAFITVLRDEALEAAKQAEEEINAGNWKGPLHGIPLAAKDFYDTAEIRTTAAFAPFQHRVPLRDAEVITRFKDAGAILMGKTNMHELGMGTTSVASHFGSVHNPWNPDYVAGGSSGGSAAAVAAGLCFATVDTDAIGSCRLPAAACGITGFKPTYGLISTRGILEGEDSGDETIVKLSHGAVQCRSVADGALLLDVLAQPPNDAPGKASYGTCFGRLARPRIGIVTNYKASDDVEAVFRKAVEIIRSSGCEVHEIEAPLSAPFDIERIDGDREAISASLFEHIDALILPTTVAGVPTIEDARPNSRAVSSENTYFCNYYALPAITVPSGLDAHGLPLGLQVVGPAFGERVVLDVAQRFEVATNVSQGARRA
jgi:aspartyl-tRNA(Asn)/glutamyl-tRNA(Gln) amidotransferase subunit A